MKYYLMSAILILSIVVGFYTLYDSNEEVEDIASYEISNRHECYQIQDNQMYNDCLSYFLKTMPYRDDERLVPTRLVD